MANDYKTDAGKVPLLEALQPFMPALWALARCMDDMQHKHKLAGSSDPFNQWAQLPDAKRRTSAAMLRHLLPEEEGVTLWSVNHKDGKHVHAVHALFNLLAAVTLHMRDNAERCGSSPDAMEWQAKAAESTGAPALTLAHPDTRALEQLRTAALALYKAGRWKLPNPDGDHTQWTDVAQAGMWASLRDALGLPPGTATEAGMGSDRIPVCRHLGGLVDGHCAECNFQVKPKACRHPVSMRNLSTLDCTLCGEAGVPLPVPAPNGPLHGPAGADWREPMPRAVRPVAAKCECGHGAHMHVPGQGCLGVQVRNRNQGRLKETRGACLCRRGL